MRPIENAIITVKYKYQQIDLELPLDMPSSELANRIIELLELKENRQINYSEHKHVIKDTNSRRILNKEETLREAGIWAGSYISVH